MFGVFFINLKSSDIEWFWKLGAFLAIVGCLVAVLAQIINANRNPEEIYEKFDGKTNIRNELEKNLIYSRRMLVALDRKWIDEEEYHMPKFEALFALFKKYEKNKDDDDFTTSESDPKKCTFLENNNDESSTKPGPFLVLGIVVIFLVFQTIMGRVETSGAVTNVKGLLTENPFANNKFDMLDKVKSNVPFAAGLFTILIVLLTVTIWYFDNVVTSHPLYPGFSLDKGDEESTPQNQAASNGA